MKRRHFLYGAGSAALALPILAEQRAAADQGLYPRRFVVYHVPEGVSDRWGDDWWPSDDLSSFRDGSAPLERHAEKLLFVRGFGFTDESDGGDDHERFMRDLLTGDGRDAPDRMVDGISIPGKMSIDRILAQHLGTDTPYPSYGIGTLSNKEKSSKSRISFDGARQSRAAENNPIAVFDALLAGVDLGSPDAGQQMSASVRRLVMRQSALDSLTGEIEDVRCSLGADGKRKLDAYLSSIRDVEQRISNQLNQPPADIPFNIERPDFGGGDGFWQDLKNAPEIGEMQTRNAVAALAADVTRVIVFQWNTTVSKQVFPWLDVYDGSLVHHDYSHEKNRDRRDDMKTISAWYAEQFATFLDLLDQVPEGDGTLLDHTTVLYCSEMGQGQHRRSDLPLILAGSPDLFRRGQVLDSLQGAGGLSSYQGRPESRERARERRLVNDFLTAVVQAHGVRLEEIGRPEANGGPYLEILR